MKKEFLLHLLQRPIAFHRAFVGFSGISGALLLSQLFYWSGKESSQDGWIYKTQAEITEETGMRRPETETARRNLRAAGVLEEKSAGMPRKMHFRIKFDALYQLLEASEEDFAGQGKGPSPNQPQKLAETNKQFESFYAQYPRKINKQEALEIWFTENLDGKHREIMDALRLWMASADWEKDGGRFVPGPQKWLKNEMWASAPAAAPRPAAHSPGLEQIAAMSATEIAAAEQRRTQLQPQIKKLARRLAIAATRDGGVL